MKTSHLLPLILAHHATAWGDLAHETIAYIAQNFVQSSTQTWAQVLLNDTSSSYLANVATWADTYKYTSEGSFSQPYHFIDAEDNPPQSCNVDYTRDCGSEGCSVSAIMNYTARVQDTTLSATEQNYALRFLVHFLGDITQPLHDEAFEIGGNEVAVTFDGETTNLHATWDTSMPEQLVGGDSLSDAESWAQSLTAEIQTGTFENVAEGWLSGLDVNDPQASAMVWAQDANAFVCSVVMPDNVSPLQSGDLYPAYYNSAIGTVELQVAKAGYRLAKWLDAIAGAAEGGSGDVMQRRAEVVVPVMKRSKLSMAKLRRAAIGYGCGCGSKHGHQHKH